MWVVIPGRSSNHEESAPTISFLATTKAAYFDRVTSSVIRSHCIAKLLLLLLLLMRTPMIYSRSGCMHACHCAAASLPTASRLIEHSRANRCTDDGLFTGGVFWEKKS
jgi:hypothetical protein